MVSIGDTLQGRYRILRLIGEGAMGAVYEGEHLLIHRRVAIKVLHAYTRSIEATARFEREAQASGLIESDHITEVLDLGRLDDGDHFIVMEFLTGETLGARFQRLGRQKPELLVPLIRQVLVGLAAAHGAGIVHRDIKPENLFVLPHKAGQRDFVKILDFGVSKFREKDDKGALALTSAGSMMGTPCYMSPEQARGQGDAGPLTDLYAVGVVLYEGLTGDIPFDGNNLNELLFRIGEGKFVPPRQRAPELDARLEALVCKALAHAPEQRFQSADAFIDALDTWAKTRGLSERVAAPSARPSGADAGVASTSPMEHSITLPRQGSGARRRGGWVIAVGLAFSASGVLIYRALPLARGTATGVELGASVPALPGAGGEASDGLPVAGVDEPARPSRGTTSDESSTDARPSVAPGNAGERASGTSPRKLRSSAARRAAAPRAGKPVQRGESTTPVSSKPDKPATARPTPAPEPSGTSKVRPDWGY